MVSNNKCHKKEQVSGKKYKDKKQEEQGKYYFFEDSRNRFSDTK